MKNCTKLFKGNGFQFEIQFGVEITEVTMKAITALQMFRFSKDNLASNSFNSQSETSV